MRNKIWTTASILAVIFATSASARKTGWSIFAGLFRGDSVTQFDDLAVTLPPSSQERYRR
jgi:hypothetical protein